MEASQTVAAIAGTVFAIFILLTYLHAIKKDCFSYYLGRSPPSTPAPSQIHNSTGGPTSAVIPSPPAIEFSKTRSGGSEDCAVCLGEFSEGESVSLLPNCSHIFHASCIDVWFRSHSSCPLCRNDVVLDLGSSSTFSSLDISQKDSTEIRYEQSREAAGLQ